MSTETLVKALEGLQNDASRRQEYNSWLQDFRRSVDAWQVSYEVLESDSYPRGLKIFCALTLRDKIVFDLHQVHRDARLHLKDQVLVLLERNVSLLTVVGAQLCVALAAFAMQAAEWEHPVQELMARFEAPKMVPLLFEFLKVIPEEFNSTRAGMVDASLRLKKTESLIQDTAPLVLNFMLSRAEIMSQSGEMQSLFFATLRPWLNEVDLPNIIASPLVDWMLASLDNMDARSASVDCLIVVLQETRDVTEPRVQEAIKSLYPKLMSVIEQAQPQYADNDDLLRDMTRLISEAVAAWHVLVCRDPQNFLPILEAMKDCIVACDGGEDLEIAEFTFDAFDMIRTMIGEPLPGSSPPVQEISRKPFEPVFLELLAQFARLLQFPESFYGNLEEEETFRDFRYDIGDMLKICSSIAGHERALKWCFMQLQAASTANAAGTAVKWQSVETVLFAIRALARTVPAEESTWMPKIYELFPRLPFVEQQVLVKHAALMLLGRYSLWSANHPQCLPFVLQYIVASVWSDLPEVRRAAAHAFLYFCTDAAKELVPFLTQILDMYGSLTGKIDLESMSKYGDGIGAIVNNLEGEELRKAIKIIFRPICERVLELVNSTCEPSIEACNQVGVEIQSLGSVVAMIQTPECDLNGSYSHPLVAEIKEQHELFLQVWLKYGPQSSALTEGVTRYYIRALFNLGINLAPELQLLMDSAVKLIKQDPMTSVMFELASAVSQTFNATSERIPQDKMPQELLEPVWNYMSAMCAALFSEKTAELLQIQGGIVDHLTILSSVLYHGFHMLCDIAYYFPQQFFSALLMPAVQLSVQVFDLCWDIEALSAVSHFYDDIQGYAPGPNGQIKANQNPIIAKQTSQVFESQGYALVHALFYWFLLKPDAGFELQVEHMTDMAFRMAPVSSVSWLQKLLDTLPPGTVSDEEKMVLAQRVFGAMTTRGFTGIGLEMNNFMKAYAARNLAAR